MEKRRIAELLTGLTLEQMIEEDFNTDPPEDVQEELKARNEERKKLRDNIPKALQKGGLWLWKIK